MQHEKPELMELGLESMHALVIVLLDEHIEKITPFYVHFYTRIITETMRVMTDYRHMSGFKLQATILSNLIQIVQTSQDLIKEPIHDQKEQHHQCASNKDFVMQLMKSLLCEMFPNLNQVQVETFIINLFNSAFDWSEFKTNVRDLLISMKSFSS